MEKKAFEIVSDLLKNKKIRFNSERYDNSDNFELFIGSMEGYIQIEYSVLRNENIVTIQFYSKCDNYGMSLYNSVIDASEIIDIDGEIEQMMDAIKEINKNISKIKSYIDKIQEICDENNMEIDDFITIEYNFE